MIENKEIIELIERNPTIGRTTSRADIELLDNTYFDITGKKIRDTGCSSCVMSALNIVRGNNGYPTINKEVHKRKSANRVAVCKSCFHVRGEGVLLTCGTPLWQKNHLTNNMVQGGKLCGCLVHVKAKFKGEDCPLNFWE